MKPVRKDVEATPDEVWRVLADGWLYPLWVVGATRIRQVDDAWPAVGSRIHHSVGVWPLVIDDYTKVVEADEPRRLRLTARAWPSGEAEVTIRLEPKGGAGTTVTIEEDLVAGPGTLVPRPARSVVLEVRNRETLQRLAWLAERRA
jgi:uncharacterized protein YndB with AHSA1/START domain